ncbi:MAG: hypothetical protein HY432_01980 [Candidatus Liptonbacteria bacterium]|nr:hypothetical protein [Candidatus Liptonbacteria bacterium]
MNNAVLCSARNWLWDIASFLSDAERRSILSDFSKRVEEHPSSDPRDIALDVANERVYGCIAD